MKLPCNFNTSASRGGLLVFTLLFAALLGGGFFSYFVLPSYFSTLYEGSVSAENISKPLLPEKRKATHIIPPTSLKAVYMTSWVAGTKALREPIITLIDETELNAIVIDIKDYTGKIAYETNSVAVKKMGGEERRITDAAELIDRLHDKGIYVIGRISVFQDQHLVKERPDLAVKKMSDKTAVWRDHKGIPWLDAGATEVWEYVAAIAKDAYELGFDELNFDYIRFPSDGNMKDIYFPWSSGRIKAEVIREFFSYLDGVLHGTGAVISADLFGMVTTNTDDLNIGQILENALPYFDYIAPMVYPSHYPPNFNGYGNPNKYPYEVVKFSMAKAVERAKLASTTPQKLRPWLQDFDYGGDYDVAEVQAQIKAVYDVGLTSWMLWSPSNRYTRGALLPDIR